MGAQVRTNSVPSWTGIGSPLSAGFFSELLLRDDLARPGQVIEISSRAVVGRFRMAVGGMCQV